MADAKIGEPLTGEQKRAWFIKLEDRHYERTKRHATLFHVKDLINERMQAASETQREVLLQVIGDIDHAVEVTNWGYERDIEKMGIACGFPSVVQEYCDSWLTDAARQKAVDFMDGK